MFDMVCKAGSYVAFPNLFGGLKFPVNRVAFTLFGVDIQWYGVIIGLGVLLCVILGLRACRHYGIETDDLLDYFLVSFPAAIVGARAYYVIFNFQRYKDNWIEIFNYREGGLAVYGGILAAMLAVLCVAKAKKKHTFLQLADFAAPYLLLGQAIGRWGNFFNQEAYGGLTDLPWGMTGSRITGVVHPTFLYESLWCFLGFAVILLYRRSRFKQACGECICLYMILYGLERSFVEGLRTDSLYIGDTGIRVSQLLSIVLLVLGIVLFIWLRKRSVCTGTISGSEEKDLATGFEETMAHLAEQNEGSEQDGE